MCMNLSILFVSIQQLRSLVWCLHENIKSVVFQWIPTQCIIPGNKAADKLVVKGFPIQTFSGEVCCRSATSIIKLALINLHTSSLKERKWEKFWNTTTLNLPYYPKCRPVAAFRMTSLHDCIYAHLHRLKLINKPAWPLCCGNLVMIADHHLLCPTLKKVFTYSLCDVKLWVVHIW